jgi:hypothetical protein
MCEVLASHSCRDQYHQLLTLSVPQGCTPHCSVYMWVRQHAVAVYAAAVHCGLLWLLDSWLCAFCYTAWGMQAVLSLCCLLFCMS